MVKNVRVTLHKQSPYRTKGNTIKVVKTPGGKLVAQYIVKRVAGVKCGDCGGVLAGIKHLRPHAMKNCKKREKTVSRAYGGSRCSHCVKERCVSLSRARCGTVSHLSLFSILQRRARLPHRGTEDRQEGPHGEDEEVDTSTSLPSADISLQ
jgi:large subunit ribosomal protein L34e